jgi:hypothetical protein
VDIALNALYESRRGARHDGPRPHKGPVVTAAELQKRAQEFRMLSLVYPLLWMWVRLDALLPWNTGHRLIARFRRRG